MPFRFDTAVLLVSAALLVALPGATPARSADDYAGKTIDFYIGGNPGGGYDTYARTITRHMGRYIPGSPNIVNKNMPGAGSGKLATFIYAAAPKNGLVIGALFPGAIQNPLVNAKMRERYDPTKLIYLASADSGTRLCFTFHTSKVKTFADALKTKAIMGASAAGGSTRDYVLLHNAISGTKFELVSGYTGTVDILLAMERGEVDGLCGIDWGSFATQRPQWLEQGKAIPLVQVALDPNEDLNRRGVPEIWKFVKGDADRQLMETVVTQQVFGRPYVAPPGTPDSYIKVLRAAFDGVLKDEKLLEDARKSRIDIAPSSGEKVQQLVHKMYAAPPELVARMEKILNPEGGAKKKKKKD